MHISDLESNRILTLLGITMAVLAIYTVVFYFLKKQAGKKSFLPGLLQNNVYYPGLFFILVMTLVFGIVLLKPFLTTGIFGYVRHALLITAILSFAVLLIRIFTVIREVLLRHYNRENPVDFSLRKAKTKFQLIQQVLNFMIIGCAIAASLMTFESIRNIGSTILASAGVLGIILGFAAQKSLGTLFAGIQIAIAQPIRLDDVVVVEDQFGTIGEISLTYVVVNTWDGRRLMVPINYFLENSFENWTRTTPEVIGKVKVYVDYTLPVNEIRKQVEKWIEESPMWDKRTRALLITDSTETTMEIRITMSARNSSDAFDLECLIREKLITYIREKYPEALPTSRLSITNTK